MKSTVRLTLACIATVSSAAGAANLVANPDFDSGLAGWSEVAGSSGTFTLDSSTGSPSSPSIHLVASTSGSASLAVASACIAIDASRHVDLVFQMSGVSGWGYASINAYSDADCATTPTTLGTPVYGASADWGAYSLLDQALPAGTHGATVILATSMGNLGSQGDVHFDHVAFGPAGTTPVSLQAFEVD
jgi:hypothetical protein